MKRIREIQTLCKPTQCLLHSLRAFEPDVREPRQAFEGVCHAIRSETVEN